MRYRPRFQTLFRDKLQVLESEQLDEILQKVKDILVLKNPKGTGGEYLRGLWAYPTTQSGTIICRFMEVEEQGKKVPVISFEDLAHI